ncbi:MAG TPA: hypothetical protein PLO37_17170 [Candidatus Hydrogenedentes bacterium]|nr:hypothetical protein [Candidatus Hydrogenedentota bacterium]HPG68579.1 hypothetical protein [Candidatus Hydrogenedentota bacterium]
MAVQVNPLVWGCDAFLPPTGPTVNALNPAVVMDGYRLENCNRIEADKHLRVFVNVGVEYPYGVKGHHLTRPIQGGIECLVDTHRGTSRFDGSIGRALRIPIPPNAVPESRDRGQWLRFEVMVTLANAAACCQVPSTRIPVWFPVERRSDGLGWCFRKGALRTNVLGMAGILEHYLLSFTPACLFIFRKK